MLNNLQNETRKGPKTADTSKPKYNLHPNPRSHWTSTIHGILKIVQKIKNFMITLSITTVHLIIFLEYYFIITKLPFILISLHWTYIYTFLHLVDFFHRLPAPCPSPSPSPSLSLSLSLSLSPSFPHFPTQTRARTLADFFHVFMHCSFFPSEI